MSQEKPEILIIGAGAVGLSIAGKLSETSEVSVVCRKRHADAILKKGLSLKGVWGEKRISNLKCFISAEDLKKTELKFDFIFITSKSSDTSTICDQYSDFLKESITVSIQNGIGNEDILKKYSKKVIGATITTNFHSDEYGSVTVQSESEPMKLGFYPDNSNAGINEITTLKKLTDLINKSGISAEISEDIRSSIWEKSLLNIAVNPVTAIFSIPVGKTLDVNLRAVISELIKEAFCVMSVENIKIRWKNSEDYLEYLFDYLIPSFSEVYTSMYQDIEIKRPTEIDFINGAVVKLGRKNNIKTPFNSCICSLLKYRENKVLLSQRTPEP